LNGIAQASKKQKTKIKLNKFIFIFYTLTAESFNRAPTVLLFSAFTRIGR
ncbi:hypothetical protein AAJ76_2220003, partial [Vairimorpha ceranae]